MSLTVCDCCATSATLAALADLGRAHHVLDQLETDHGDAHAGVGPRTSERQHHIGLGYAGIDRAVFAAERLQSSIGKAIRHGNVEFKTLHVDHEGQVAQR
jgi:hypothetical protein